ncbi:MAG: alpha/beta hydrolase [Patulibacter minatonensis]
MLGYDDTPGGDRAIVLVHGLAASRAVWASTVPLLVARGWRVVAVDVPGFGASPPAGDGFELDAVAGALVAGLPDDLDRFTLVGHSMGGAVALTAASLAAERVDGLVLCASAGLTPVPIPDWVMGPASAAWEVAVQARRALEPLAAYPLGRRLLLGPSTAPGDALGEEEVRSIVRATADARRTADALATVARADLRPLLERLRVPVGLLWGSADLVVPRRVLEAGLAVRPWMPHTVLEDTAHLPMVERPGAFVDALLALVDELDGERGVHTTETTSG